MSPVNAPSPNREAIVLREAAAMLQERNLGPQRFDTLLQNNADQAELVRRISRNNGVAMQQSEVVSALQREQTNVANTLRHHQNFAPQTVQRVEIEVKREQPGWLSRWYIKWPLIIGAVGLAAYFGWPYLKEWLETWNKQVAEKAAKALEMQNQTKFKIAETQKIDEYTQKTTTSGSGGGGTSTTEMNLKDLGQEALKKLQQGTKESLDKGTFEFPRGP